MDIIQGNLLVKKKRKWKSRWVILRRVNPASQRINLYIYKNHLSAISKQKEKQFFPLRDYCAVESIDKENRLPKLVIITATQSLSLRFQEKEERDNWTDAIVAEGNYGEDVPFDVVFPSKQPWKSADSVTLHIYPDFFSLVRKHNCRCVGRWSFEQLFNYGTVDGGFVFRVDSVAGGAEEPESFLLLTSLEKQINRTFDTVYKTARNMYGSADGLQRSPKVNTVATPRPRSMSEPSGFKRFMHRLSLRRKSRRPKKAKSSAVKLDVSHGAPAETGDAASAVFSPPSVGGSVDTSDRESQSDHNRRQSEQSHGMLSSSDVSPIDVSPIANPKANCGNGPTNVNGFHFDVNDGSNKNINISERGRELGNDLRGKGECAENGRERQIHVTSNESGPCLSVPSQDMSTIWQRRSALMDESLTEEDMIKKGLMKPKQRERPTSMGDPLTSGILGNYGGKDPGHPAEGDGGIQGRRNTSGGKRLMLTIAIAPSGSEPSLTKARDNTRTSNAQYVNLPAEPIKNKQIDKLKEGEWARYDSEENVYHHLAAVVGAQGYENLPDQSLNRSITSINKSYENVPGMVKDASYENMGAGRGNMHYVNVDAGKEKQSVNYIRVAGSGPPTPISKNPVYSFSSRKKDSNYTVIDVEKTQKLLEMTKQAKRPVERAKKN